MTTQIQTSNYNHLDKILKLAIPTACSYLGIMAMGMVDLLVVGRLGAVATAAVGLSTAVFAAFIVPGVGLVAGLEFPASRGFGRGSVEESTRALGQGLILALVGGIPATAGVLLIASRLDLLGATPEVAAAAGPYLSILAWGLVPSYAYAAMRSFLQSVQIVRAPLAVMVAANVLNAAANIALVYGHWGAPSLGLPGSAIATVAARLALCLGLAVTVWIWLVSRSARRAWLRFSWDHFVEITRLGVPAAAQMMLEVGAFSLATILVARLSAAASAAHNIVLNIASVTFMVPLGIGAATSALVGEAVGRQLPREGRLLGWTGLGVGVGFMALSAVGLILFAPPILGLYTNDADAIAFGTKILVAAALFQISDGCQVVLTGALRGTGDTHHAMKANLLGHWLIGLPIGLVLCFPLGRGVVGMWTGLALGLTAVAARLLWVWWKLGTQISASSPMMESEVIPR